eukprot:2033039-Lingulodinium_polyedra.AAC.1
MTPPTRGMTRPPADADEAGAACAAPEAEAADPEASPRIAQCPMGKNAFSRMSRTHPVSKGQRWNSAGAT